jgi:uncharacterized protein DUF3383
MTIPASSIVKINPGVVNAGGAGLVLNALFLTENLAMPTGQVLSFAPGPVGNLAQNVAAFFGSGSAEAAAAAIYFLGYQNSTLKPSQMLFAAYNAAARSAFMNSGSWANIPLATLQALAPGTLTINFAGTPLTSASINLSAATSFSNAAALILAGFTSPGFTVTFSATTNQFVITSTATGATETVVFATGALAAGLLLTQATGATLSQGAAADTPNSAMNNALAASQNWSTMVTLFEPTLTNKEAFAVWFNASDDAYLWLAWDSDTQASVQGATEPFGVVALTAQYNGVACIGGDPAILTYIPPGGTTPLIPAGTTLAQLVENVAIFVAGAIASINFGQTNGRVTLAFLSQSGLLPTCANGQTYQNLLTNGYSSYGAFATRNQGFTFFTNSNMPGEFDWIDTYVDDIWLTDQFAVQYMTLLTSLGSIAFNANGYGALRAGLVGGPIAAALNFGAIRTGVVLSASQIEDVNTQAGQVVNQIISSQGYYLQILDPGATVRQERGSPIINFWYTDGGSIQLINMSSLDLL